MAVPFNLPDEQVEAGATAASGSSSVASTVPNSPSHPIPIPQPNSQQSQPQIPAIDNEALVQAFYEALCRCSQAPTPGQFSHSSQFWYPSPSTSNVSSPRSSFRNVPRRRANSFGGFSEYSVQSYESEWDQHHQPGEESQAHVPVRNAKKKKPKERPHKIKNFFISALQFVIDNLK